VTEQEENTALEYWKDHREQMRQSETQRAVLTNYILLIAAALSGFVVQQQFSLRTLPLSVLTMAAGLYGAVSAAKYHERADYHLSQARALTRVLVQAGSLPDAGTALEDARQAHYSRYPRLSRIRLSWLWISLHLGIAVYGAVLLIITCAVQLPAKSRCDRDADKRVTDDTSRWPATPGHRLAGLPEFRSQGHHPHLRLQGRAGTLPCMAAGPNPRT
jgi:hypothetical protein